MKIDWCDAKKHMDPLTDEERRIVELLAQRKTQPEIARALGQHRSMIWRKIRRIKQRLNLPTQNIDEGS